MSYYAVVTGRNPGIYRSWNECWSEINKFPSSRYKKFSTEQDAINFINNQRTLNFSLATKKIYTDGACSSNGTYASRAGYGVYIPGHEELNLSERLSGKQSNNRAELMAISKAIDICVEKWPHEQCIIYTDSMYCINSLTKWALEWSRNNWMLKNGGPVQNRELIEPLFETLKSKPSMRLQYVKSHSGDYGNEIADMLARNGASLDES